MRAFFRQLAFWLVVLLATLMVVQLLFGPIAPQPSRAPPPSAQPIARLSPPGDQRRPLDEFTLSGAKDQAEMRRRLAATQSLSCDSAASLVYRPDVIVFAAHEILNENGTLQYGVSRCAFRVTTQGTDGKTHVEDYPILFDTLDYGPLVEQGADSGDAWLQSNVDDWAVARLARPVTGIEPYPLVPQREIASLQGPDTRIVTVSPKTLNWHGKDASLAGSCRTVMRDADTALRFPSLQYSDCFSGRGGSGGAVLADDGRGGLRYLATMIAVDRPCADDGALTCIVTSRSLDADLVARIKGTTGPLDGAEDAPFRAAQAGRLANARAATTEAIARELVAPMKVTDAASGVASRYYARMQQAYAEGHYDAIEALGTQAVEALGGVGVGWNRPEMALVSRLRGDGLRALKRPQDASYAYDLALPTADPVLAGYLALRLGETEDDKTERREHLMEAYRIGGRTLFERFGDVAEVPDFGG